MSRSIVLALSVATACGGEPRERAAADAADAQPSGAAGADFMPGGEPLPIVIAARRWGDAADGGEASFATRASNETFHLSIRRQAEDLAAYLTLAAPSTDGRSRAFTIRCAGDGCPPEAAHPPGAPAIWFGTASDFPSHAFVRAAFADPSATPPVEGRQRYVLGPDGPSYYVVGASERATDPALWGLLDALGYRHFAPGPAWEVPPQLPSPPVVGVARDVTPRALFHAFILQPDPQSGFGQEDWLRHNRLGDDSLRALQGQAISGSNHHPQLPELQRLNEVIPHVMDRWRVELSRLAPATRACHAACVDQGEAPSECARQCLPTGTVPPETLCAPLFVDAPAVTVRSRDPASQAAIEDYFATLAIAFFRAYPFADTYSMELSDRTTPCCDGGCCDASCERTAGAETTNAYVALANAVAARLRACPASVCPWNGADPPEHKRVVTAIYNNTGTPPTIDYDPDVVAMVNLDHAAPDALERVAERAAAATLGTYGYGFVERGRLVDRGPARAGDYLEHLAGLDARAAPARNAWVFVESYRAALARTVQWQAAFRYLWGEPGTRAQAEATREDFFARAFPEPASRERMRRFYEHLERYDETPSDELLALCQRDLAEARALAVSTCAPEVCGAAGEPRFERMLDRFDSLILWMHGRGLAYRLLDARPHEGVFAWGDAVAPGADASAVGEHLARTRSVEGAQGAALFDLGDHPEAVADYLAAHPGEPAPYGRAEIDDLSRADRGLAPADWDAPTFSDDLVAPPPGVPVACADDACGGFASDPAQGAASFAYFDYQLQLGAEATLPLVVGLGESPGYFVQVWSDEARRWQDVFGGRQVRSAFADCAPLDVRDGERAELAALAQRRVRLLAGYHSSSSPGVCEQEVWAAPPRRALRTPISPTRDVHSDVATTVQHFYVPPGLDHLDVYGLEGACLVSPRGDFIAAGDVRDGPCRFEAGVPCPCTPEGAPIVDAHHRFVPGVFLRETRIPIDPAAWGIWRMYKSPSPTVAPLTFRNVPPYLAARAALLPVPAECVGGDGQAAPRCGH